MKGRNRLDIHVRLIRASYRKTPWYWYAPIIVIIMAMAIAMVDVYETKLPVYGVLLGLIIPPVFMVPCGIIQGITNVDANQLKVLSEFIGDTCLKVNRYLANMIFKILSTDVVGQGMYFATDMKLAHYLKLSPRTTFITQGVATILGALTQAGVTLALYRYTRKRFWKLINWSLIFVGTYNIPPDTCPPGEDPPYRFNFN